MATPTPPTIPTGRELYDALMAHIEPELTTEGAKALKVKYKNESHEDRAARMRRYELAFERCEQSYNEYMETLHAQVTRYQKQAVAHVELQDRKTDESHLDRIASFILKSA